MDFLHGRWFNKDDIYLDVGNRVLDVNFGYPSFEDRSLLKNYLVVSMWKIPIYLCKLRIGNAVSYKAANEGAVIGAAFRDIQYNDNPREVAIVTNTAMKIIVRVDEFAVEVEKTADVLREKEFWKFF